jgi:uncharacterized membrane protein
MAKWIKEIIISSIALLILDGAYIALNQRAFENQVASVQRVILQVNLVGAIICYFFLIFGLNYFIISKKRTLLDAFLFGIVIYGVYETTNYSIINKWDKKAVIMDTLWGGLLFAATTGAVYKLRRIL